MPFGDPLVRWRLVGLAGTALVALAATGLGVFPRGDPWNDFLLVRLLRDEPLGAAIGFAAFVVGMSIFVLAWASLGRLLGTPDAPGTRWLMVTTALWSVPLAIAPPMFSRDVYSYAAQGQLVANGIDPYTYGPDELGSEWLASISPIWRDTPAPYGPLFLLGSRVVTALSFGNLTAAVLILRLVAIAGVIMVALAIPYLARACGVSVRDATWLGLASPLLLVHGIGGAHNDALMLGLLAAGLAFAVRRRPALGVVLLALAVAVKVTAIVVVPFAALLWARRLTGPTATPADVGRRLVRACVLAGGLAIGVFGALTLATGLGLGWIAALRTPGVAQVWTSLPTGVGMAVYWTGRAVGLPLDRAAVVGTTRAIGFAVLFAVLVALWWRVRHRLADTPEDTRRVVAGAGWALLAVVVLAPAFYPWYLPSAVTLLAVAVVAPAVRRGFAIATGALCFLILPNGMGIAEYIQVPGLVLDVVVTVGAVVLLIRWWRRRGAVVSEPADPVGAGGPPPR